MLPDDLGAVATGDDEIRVIATGPDDDSLIISILDPVILQRVADALLRFGTHQFAAVGSVDQMLRVIRILTVRLLFLFEAVIFTSQVPESRPGGFA